LVNNVCNGVRRGDARPPPIRTNSTFGLGGSVIGQVATACAAGGDFGQTLFVWWISEGPTWYGLFGPLDAALCGRICRDMAANPLGCC